MLSFPSVPLSFRLYLPPTGRTLLRLITRLHASRRTHPKVDVLVSGFGLRSRISADYLRKREKKMKRICKESSRFNLCSCSLIIMRQRLNRRGKPENLENFLRMCIWSDKTATLKSKSVLPWTRFLKSLWKHYPLFLLNVEQFTCT